MEPARILIVDDSEPIRRLLGEQLHRLGHASEAAASGEEALARLHPGIDLVLLDVEMSGIDGFETARRLREQASGIDLPIIMVTGQGTRQDRLRAVEAGANDFIAKPVDLTELRVRVTSILRMKAAQDEVKRYQAHLESLVAARTQALQQALDEVVAARQYTYQAYLDTLQRLAVAAEYRDGSTAAHLQRVSRYAALLARGLGLPANEVEAIRLASPMHDVGKLGIPDHILLKHGPLTQEERALMQRHTDIGAAIMEGSPSELLQLGALIARSHHEQWDGTGYPNGLAGEAIPLPGRICAVADVFDALTTSRPYKPAFSIEQACEELVAGRGRHFEARLVDCFLDHRQAVAEICRELSDPHAARP